MIVITGPTACGKTKLSISIAKDINSQIVAMDSMQVYRRMNIGTAKPTVKEMDGITHHMLDVVEPNEDYSVVQYREEAVRCINKLHAHGKTPVFVGGTGLYLKSLMNDMHMGNVLGDKRIRQKYELFLQQEGNVALHNRLLCVDRLSATRLHPNDTKRIIRALEVFELTGTPLSEQVKKTMPCQYSFTVLGLQMERSILIERINKRVMHMFEMGLVNEVEALVKEGVPYTSQSMQGIGYKELIPYLNNDLSLDATIEAIKIRTRQYAKRQMTWFRKMPDIHWLPANESLLANALNLIKNKPTSV